MTQNQCQSSRRQPKDIQSIGTLQPVYIPTPIPDIIYETKNKTTFI